MIPADVDMTSLAAQLDEDGIAFGTPNPSNGPLEAHLQHSIASADGTILNNVGVVILEQTPEQPADLRDIAHDLEKATGLDPVIVRTPHASGAVSGTLTRHRVESAQREMMAQPDYGDGLHAFASAATEDVTAWPLFAAAAFTALGVVIAGTWSMVKRFSLT